MHSIQRAVKAAKVGGLQGIMLRVLDFEGEAITLCADNNALFLAALAECMAMNRTGREKRQASQETRGAA